MKDKVNFYLRIIFCTALIGTWCFYFIHFGKPPQEKHQTPLKKISKKQKKSKIAIITKKNTSKEIFKTKPNEPSTIINSESKTINKVEKPKETKPVEQTIVIKSTETKSPIIKPAIKPINVNSLNVAGATKDLISKETAKKQIQIPDQPLRKEVKIENPITEPVLKKLKEPDVEKPSSQLEATTPSTTDQIEIKGIIGDSKGANEVIITDKTNNHSQTLKIGDSYNGVRLIKIIDRDIYFKDLLLKKIYKKTFSKD